MTKGTRMCAGALLANRQLYILFLRLIWAFRIELSKNESQNDWSVDPLKVGPMSMSVRSDADS